VTELNQSNLKGCAGRVAGVSTVMAVLGAYLLIGGHYQTVAGGEQALSDNGAHLAQDHETG
jgi:hypothetical protein